jgi:hypothetical protein
MTRREARKEQLYRTWSKAESQYRAELAGLYSTADAEIAAGYHRTLDKLQRIMYQAEDEFISMVQEEAPGWSPRTEEGDWNPWRALV